jgi:hypothetical protein
MVFEVRQTHSRSRFFMTYYLGWILYVACIVLAAGYVGLFVLVSVIAVGTDPFRSPVSFAIMVVPALLIYGLGRDFLYVLTGA